MQHNFQNIFGKFSTERQLSKTAQDTDISETRSPSEQKERTSIKLPPYQQERIV